MRYKAEAARLCLWEMIIYSHSLFCFFHLHSLKQRPKRVEKSIVRGVYSVVCFTLSNFFLVLLFIKGISAAASHSTWMEQRAPNRSMIGIKRELDWTCHIKKSTMTPEQSIWLNDSCSWGGELKAAGSKQVKLSSSCDTGNWKGFSQAQL